MTHLPAIIVSIGLALTAGGTLWGARDFSAARRLLAQQDALIASQDAVLTRTKQENALMAKFARSVVARQMAVEAGP